MRRLNAFLILLVVSLASLIVLVAVGFAIFSAPASQYPSGWMGEMWGMMGGSGTVTSSNPSLWVFGVLFVVLVGVLVAGVAGLAYYAAFPEITTHSAGIVTSPPDKVNNAGVREVPKNTSAYESVAKTLTGEERKVVEVLVAHDGQYLQKYIRKEADLSRLKTHRIVARLAERGIVTLEKSGNTNQVLLADWLKHPQ